MCHTIRLLVGGANIKSWLRHVSIEGIDFGVRGNSLANSLSWPTHLHDRVYRIKNPDMTEQHRAKNVTLLFMEGLLANDDV